MSYQFTEVRQWGLRAIIHQVETAEYFVTKTDAAKAFTKAKRNKSNYRVTMSKVTTNHALPPKLLLLAAMNQKGFIFNDLNRPGHWNNPVILKEFNR